MVDNIEEKPPSNWIPEQNLLRLAIIGKTVEETGELLKELGRCIIQGVEGADPETGVPNITALEKEVADVYSRLDHISDHFQFDLLKLENRRGAKYRYHEKWLHWLTGMIRRG